MYYSYSVKKTSVVFIQLWLQCIMHIFLTPLNLNLLITWNLRFCCLLGYIASGLGVYIPYITYKYSLCVHITPVHGHFSSSVFWTFTTAILNICSRSDKQDFCGDKILNKNVPCFHDVLHNQFIVKFVFHDKCMHVTVIKLLFHDFYW